jgi:hypothetical protein
LGHQLWSFPKDVRLVIASVYQKSKQLKMPKTEDKAAGSTHKYPNHQMKSLYYHHSPSPFPVAIPFDFLVSLFN